MFWRDPGQRCHFARSVHWAVASSPQCVAGCKRNVDPPEEWKSLGEIPKRKLFTCERETFVKGQEKKKAFLAIGTWPWCEC